MMTSHTSDKISKKPRFWIQPVILLLVISGIFIATYLLGIEQYLGELQPWIHSWGIWAPGIYLIIYLGIVIASVPATPFGIIAGIMFGSTIGIILIIIGASGMY